MAKKEFPDRLSEQPGFGPAGSEEYQPRKKLDFTDEQGMTIESEPPKDVKPLGELKKGAMMDALASLVQKANENINNSYQLQKDSGDIMMDRIKMKNHPEVAGPRIPDVSLFGGEGMLPREKEYADSMASGMMGSIGTVGSKAAQAAAPEVKAVIAKSGPWMKGATQEVVDAAIAKGEGLANTASPMIREYLQKLKALSKRY